MRRRQQAGAGTTSEAHADVEGGATAAANRRRRHNAQTEGSGDGGRGGGGGRVSDGGHQQRPGAQGNPRGAGCEGWGERRPRPRSRRWPSPGGPGARRDALAPTSGSRAPPPTGNAMDARAPNLTDQSKVAAIASRGRSREKGGKTTSEGGRQAAAGGRSGRGGRRQCGQSQWSRAASWPTSSSGAEYAATPRRRDAASAARLGTPPGGAASVSAGGNAPPARRAVGTR